MKRSIENRLQKLEQMDGKVVLIAFGPDETAEEASDNRRLASALPEA